MLTQDRSNPHFQLLFPNIFGFKGGIQVYSQFLLESLKELYPEGSYDVFLKYDRPSEIPQAQYKTRFHSLGQFPRAVQSVLLTLSPLLEGIVKAPHLMIATHVNYGVACYVLKQLTGVPYWLVVHGLEGWNLSHPLRVKALENAERVIAVSEYTKDRLLKEQNLDSRQIRVLPNTFKKGEFFPTRKPDYLLKRYGLKSEQKIILSVSRLGKSAVYKGYDQIIQSLAKLRLKEQNLHYILVGKGDDTPRIMELVKQLDLENHVTLTGFIPDEELRDHYNLCDVFALPSTGEGFGIVYLEALACGKPVLAGDRDGAVDPLLKGKLGCLVNPENQEEITEALGQLLNKTYPNQVLFEPKILREEVIKHFELKQFQKTLSDLMLEFAERVPFDVSEWDYEWL